MTTTTLVPDPAIVDATPCSVVIGCVCGWRAIEITDDLARLLYAEHRAAEHRVSPVTVADCPLCDQRDVLLPRLQICRRCHRALRAAKARGVYAEHGRADRRPA